MTLGRHARHYLLIGGVQWLVDWGVLVLLTRYGMQVESANVLGRVAGALLGYWLNGKLTFADIAAECGNEFYCGLELTMLQFAADRAAQLAYKQELPPGTPMRVFPFMLQPEPMPLA